MLKRLRFQEDWIAVALLCVMLTIAASGVARAKWVEEGLNSMWLVSVVGVLAGLALAKSRFSGWVATLFAIIYGTFWGGLLICNEMLVGDWHRRSLELVVRINNFLYKVLHGGTSRDTLPFIAAVALLFWFFGIVAAWSVFRRGTEWPAIIPAGVGLIVNNYYYFGSEDISLYLPVYMFLALIFIAHLSLLARERKWFESRVRFSPELRFDFLRAGLAVAIVGVSIGWAMPAWAASPSAATTWRQMTSSFGFMREIWIRLFSSVRGYGQANTDFYGDSLALAGPARLSNEPIMDISVNVVAEDNGAASAIQRYYWRAAAYSLYADGRWQVGDVTYRDYQPNKTNFNLPTYRLRRDVSLAILPHIPASSRLYMAGQVRWVDLNSMWEVTFDPENMVDATGIKAQQVLARGTPYSLIASISVADQTSLQAAGTNYPGWVTENFLQLPPDITQRTRDLAQQIVADANATTPYDQAQAINDWLRNNIKYEQEVNSAPPDQDPVDYFLFETREGYCNYYASAMVVMLRSLGVPARLTVGFAQGELMPNTQTYRILQEQAHAWPEVYFPQYGWVEFEPTVSQDPIVRPQVQPEGSGEDDGTDTTTNPSNDRDDNLPDEEFENLTDAEDPATGGQTNTNPALGFLERLPLAQIALVTVGALAALGLATVFLVRANVLGWENFGKFGGWVLKTQGKVFPSLVGLAYLNLERAGRWLGIARGPGVTPHERAAAFTAAIPRTKDGVDTITQQYATEQYSPRPADGEAARDAWHNIRFKVWHDAVSAFLLRYLEEDELLATAREKAQNLLRR